MPAGVSDRTRDTHSGKKRIQEGQRKVCREKATAFCPWHRVSLLLTHSLREPTRLCPESVASRWRPPPVRGHLDKEAPAALRSGRGPQAVLHTPLAQSSFLHPAAVRPEFQFSFHHQVTAVFYLSKPQFSQLF